MTLKRVHLAVLAIITLALAVYVRSNVAGNQPIYRSTGWVFLVAVACACILLLETVIANVQPSAPTVAGLRLLVGTTLAMLFVAEGTLRFTHRWDSYMEINGNAYVSPYNGPPTWFFTYYPGETFHITRPEYTYDRHINSMGSADREFVVSKAPHEYRILALGDSFTEGLGTSAENSWPKVMERRLAARYPGSQISAYNAGVAGSDPFYELMLLKGKLSVFHPDLVIVDTNTSDVNDMIIRGGAERFRPDGKTAYRQPPWWERLFGLNYIARATLQTLGYDYDFLLVKKSDIPELNRESSQLIGEAIQSIVDYCRMHDMRLLVVANPMQYEIAQQSYHDPWYNGLVRRLADDPDLHFVDLMQYFQRHGLITRDNAAKYYLRLDLHHNTDGYRMMGESIADTVIRMDLGPDSGQTPAQTSRLATPAVAKAVANKQ